MPLGADILCIDRNAARDKLCGHRLSDLERSRGADRSGGDLAVFALQLDLDEAGFFLETKAVANGFTEQARLLA